MLPRFALLALALVACAPSVRSDASPDAEPDAEPDAAMDAAPMDAEPDAAMVEDTGASADTGTVEDTGVPPTDTGAQPADTGVSPRDTGVGDTGLPPCTLDPRNCGMCGRVCGAGALSGRPSCAEVATGRWDCVQFCDGFGEGCPAIGGGRVCCASGCALGADGCR